MVANTKSGLQRRMDALNKTEEEFRMRVDIKKTKVMRISKKEAK